eukprot:1417589-Pyramimonas_sp.AAC.1
MIPYLLCASPREGDLGRGGLQGTGPRAGQLGRPRASRGLSPTLPTSHTKEKTIHEERETIEVEGHQDDHDEDPICPLEHE